MSEQHRGSVPIRTPIAQSTIAIFDRIWQPETLRSALGRWAEELPLACDVVVLGARTAPGLFLLRWQGHRVTAVDPAPELLLVAIEDERVSDAVCSIAVRTPLPDFSADVVAFSTAAIAAEDIDALIAEAIRLTRADGMIVAGWPVDLAATVEPSRWTKLRHPIATRRAMALAPRVLDPAVRADLIAAASTQGLALVWESAREEGIYAIAFERAVRGGNDLDDEP